MRKHYTQLEPDEVLAIKKSLVGPLSTTPHFEERISERAAGIRWPEIYKTLATGAVIEVHNDIPGDLRALYRAKVWGRSVIVVVSLTRKQFITAWANTNSDTHRTLDMSIYNWTDSVLPALQQGV